MSNLSGLAGGLNRSTQHLLGVYSATLREGLTGVGVRPVKQAK